jgi:hypothetical protein
MLKELVVSIYNPILTGIVWPIEHGKMFSGKYITVWARNSEPEAVNATCSICHNLLYTSAPRTRPASAYVNCSLVCLFDVVLSAVWIKLHGLEFQDYCGLRWVWRELIVACFKVVSPYLERISNTTNNLWGWHFLGDDIRTRDLSEF